MKRFINTEETYEGMIYRLKEAREYGRIGDVDEEEWCLRDDPDFDEVRAA